MAAAVPKNEDADARKVMDIMFTKGVSEAEKFLDTVIPKDVESSPKLHCAKGYVWFVKALMTWDEDVIEGTIHEVKNVEEKVIALAKGKKKLKPSAVEQLVYQIIEGDCTLIRGILTFTKMTLKGYVKAGFLLRSASKIYEKCHKAVERLIADRQPSAASMETVAVGGPNFNDLKASVDLGFGLVNLIMSLMPDKIMTFIKLLGFGADKAAALDALQCCSSSGDMRSPIAKLVLLWYHSVSRATLGLDGFNLKAGISDSQRIMREAGDAYTTSPLFLYFKGRIEYLKKDTEQALRYFKESVELSGDQREVKHVNMYELGFIHITRLEWKNAADAFYMLKTETRWSIGYYTYIYALCLAADGNVTAANAELQSIPSVVRNKKSNYEKFVLRRSAMCKSNPLKQHEGVLYALQLAYEWNQLSYLQAPQCHKLLSAVKALHAHTTSDPYMEAVSLGLQGAILMQTGDLKEAESNFRAVLERAYPCIAKKELQVPAYATMEIGLIYVRRNEYEKAKNAFNKAKNAYNDYEVETRLLAKTHAMLLYLKQLKQKESETSSRVHTTEQSSVPPNGIALPPPATTDTQHAARSSSKDIRAALEEVESEQNGQSVVNQQATIGESDGKQSGQIASEREDTVTKIQGRGTDTINRGDCDDASYQNGRSSSPSERSNEVAGARNGDHLDEDFTDK